VVKGGRVWPNGQSAVILRNLDRLALTDSSIVATFAFYEDQMFTGEAGGIF
jgi:hypothetical protein